MTSFAFILGVLPLAISSGAGSGGQNAIGTGVIGGMLCATVLAVFYVPMFFVAVLSWLRVRQRSLDEAPGSGVPLPQGGSGDAQADRVSDLSAVVRRLHVGTQV
jgi:hypothetical protein